MGFGPREHKCLEADEAKAVTVDIDPTPKKMRRSYKGLREELTEVNMVKARSANLHHCQPMARPHNITPRAAKRIQDVFA